MSIRQWTCPVCGRDHDRHINAAINIRNEGMRICSAYFLEQAHKDTQARERAKARTAARKNKNKEKKVVQGNVA